MNRIQSQKLGENDEKEKEPIDIEFINHNADPENNENAIDFRQSDVQEEDNKEIAKVSLIESLQKQN